MFMKKHTVDEFHGQMKIVQLSIGCLQHTESCHDFCLVVFRDFTKIKFKVWRETKEKFFVRNWKYLQGLDNNFKISISFSENAVVRSVKQSVLVESKFS